MNGEYSLLINKSLMYLYYILLTAVSSYGIINFKKQSYNIKLLTLLIIILSVSELYNFLQFINGFPTSRVYHFSLPINIVLFYFIFKPYWKQKKVVIYTGILTVLATILSIINSIFNVEFDDFPANGLVFLSVIAIVFSLITLKSIISAPAQHSLFIKPEFWISITILIFFTVSYLYLSLFQFYDIFIQNNLQFIGIIFRIFTLLYYIGFFLAIYFNIKQNYANRS